MAKRKTPSIKNILTKATFTETEPQVGIRKCGKQCVTCSHLKEVKCVNFGDKPFYLRNSFSCNAKNIIYLLVCTCMKFYIGESQELRQRVFLHRSHAKSVKNQSLFVSKHLSQCSNGQFTIYPFYQMQNDDPIARREKEKYFISKFNPELNSDT